MRAPHEQHRDHGQGSPHGGGRGGAEVQFLRLQDYYIKPCTGCNSCAIDIMEKGGGGKCSLKGDDFPFIDNLVMDCDGLILGSPIYEKSPTGLFKTLEDRMGPSHDQGFRIIAKKIREEKGITTGTGPDPRAFKARAASLIAVGGSEWDTLALPIMGMFCLTMQITVVDQILINWIGLPKVVTFHEDMLARAHRSGKHVVETLKKGVENAEYIGEPGMCPLCHSKLVEVRHGSDPYPCICALCGVRGTLTTDADGQVHFTVSTRTGPTPTSCSRASSSICRNWRTCRSCRRPTTARPAPAPSSTATTLPRSSPRPATRVRRRTRARSCSRGLLP